MGLPPNIKGVHYTVSYKEKGASEWTETGTIHSSEGEATLEAAFLVMKGFDHCITTNINTDF